MFDCSEVSGDREVQRTMLELLNQLDGFSSDERIKVCIWFFSSIYLYFSDLCDQENYINTCFHWVKSFILYLLITYVLPLIAKYVYYNN